MTRARNPSIVANLTSLAWLGAEDLDAANLFDDTLNGPPTPSNSRAAV